MDRVPQTPSGKIQKCLLREHYLASHARDDERRRQPPAELADAHSAVRLRFSPDRYAAGRARKR